MGMDPKAFQLSRDEICRRLETRRAGMSGRRSALRATLVALVPVAGFLMRRKIAPTALLARSAAQLGRSFWSRLGKKFRRNGH